MYSSICFFVPRGKFQFLTFEELAGGTESMELVEVRSLAFLSNDPTRSFLCAEASRYRNFGTRDVAQCSKFSIISLEDTPCPSSSSINLYLLSSRISFSLTSSEPNPSLSSAGANPSPLSFRANSSVPLSRVVPSILSPGPIIVSEEVE
jgi:hypothetical protein